VPVTKKSLIRLVTVTLQCYDIIIFEFAMDVASEKKNASLQEEAKRASEDCTVGATKKASSYTYISLYDIGHDERSPRCLWVPGRVCDSCAIL